MYRKQILREYKKGREKNFFIWEDGKGNFYFDKITKSCGFTIKCGTEKDVFDFVENNGYKFAGLVVRA